MIICRLVQRLDDLARFRVYIDGIRLFGVIAHAGAQFLDLFAHSGDKRIFLRCQDAVNRELCLGVGDARVAVRFLQRKARDYGVGILIPRQDAHEVAGKAFQGACRQREDHREDFSLAQEIQTSAVLAGFRAVLAGAESVIRTGLAYAARIALTARSVIAAAVRRI